MNKTIDPRGKASFMQYDELRRLNYVRSPEGNIQTFGYDQAGNQTSTGWSKDGEAIVSTYEYDPYGRLLVQYLPKTAGSSSAPEHTYSYDRLGNLSFDTDALGNGRTYSYDGLNRLTSELDGAGFSSGFEYDNGGRLTESTDPNGTVSAYEYDNRGLLLGRTMNNGGEIKTLNYSYDEAGALKWATDDGVFTGYNGARQSVQGSYTPDVYGRITDVANILDGRTFSAGYEYNISDRIVGITNPDGREVSYDYNLLGEITDVQGYLSGSPVYDAGGFITSITAANGVSLTLDYDDEGKMTNRAFRSSASEDLKGYSFSYDEAGNITRLNENFYSYDKRNQLTFAVLNGSFGVDPEDTNQETMAIEKDDVLGTDILEEVATDAIIALDYAAGSIGVDLMGSYEVAQVYLRPGMVSRVTAEELKVFVSDTNNAGSEYWSEIAEFEVQEAEDGGFNIILSTPVTARYVKVKTDYNERNTDFQPIDFAEFKASAKDIIKVYYYAPQRVEDYEYDKAGNRTSRNISYNTNITEKTSSYIYYPGTNRLLTDGRYAFQYDENGNMRAKGSVILHEGVETEVSDVTDWIGYTSSIIGDSGSISIADNNETWNYEYDLLNRLVSAAKNTETVANYTYNAEGLRVKKEKNSEAEYYFFDLGGNLIYEEHADETYTSYTYIQNTRFARENGNVDGSITPVRYYYHTDHLGSTVLVTDETGEVIWDGEYTPFGELNDPLNIGDGVVQFTGKDMDFDTGLYYYNARWYDPDLGRFVTEDPIKDGSNWYAYVSNNPLRYVDPTGLFFKELKEKWDNWREERRREKSFKELSDYTIDISKYQNMEFKIDFYIDENVDPITVTFDGDTYTVGVDLDIGDTVPFDATFNVPEGSSLEIEGGDSSFMMPGTGETNLPEVFGRYNDIVKSDAFKDEMKNQKAMGAVELVGGLALFVGGAFAEKVSSVYGLYIMADGAHMFSNAKSGNRVKPGEMLIKLLKNKQ